MLFILLPAFNEEVSLPPLLTKLHTVLTDLGLPYRILVGNDGSRDGTLELLKEYAQRLPIEVVNHKINRGLGETSRDLFERAAELAQPGDRIVRMDCDDTHEPLYIPVMLKRIEEGFDVVIASRFQTGGGQLGLSAYRTVISRAANLFMKLFFPIAGVHDYSCGFRMYRAEIIMRAVRTYGNSFIQLKGMGFTGTLEKLLKLKLLGARFAEIPFVLRYDQKRSVSKMVSSITTLGYLTMAILYYWPWNGWRRQYQGLKDLPPQMENV
jgi:dolichol-phosphate mannosyltransferase